MKIGQSIQYPELTRVPSGHWKVKLSSDEKGITNSEDTVVLLMGNVNSMGHAQRLHCCRQLAGAMGIRAEWPGLPPPQAFPSSLFLSDEGLKKAVKGCKDINELLELCDENKYRVQRQPLIQQWFADRQRELEE